MSDMFVFDIYTLEVFCSIFGVLASAHLGVTVACRLSKNYPEKAKTAAKLGWPLFFLLILGFCSLQIAAPIRHIHQRELARGQ